jgi:hypothetical protein
MLLAVAPTTLAQSKTYPKEIRGYKVHRGAVEPKNKVRDADDQTQLIQFGDASVARVTPLGITLEIPIVVSPVQQKGRVDFLVFENMIVNGTSVEIDEYHRAFDLPNDKPLTLKEPLRFFVYLPRAVLAAIDELSARAKQWPITGVVYVFGRFKKGIFRFKRVIPIELNIKIHNPLRDN